MARASASVTTNPAVVNRVLSQAGMQWGGRVGRAVVNQAKRNVPVDEGRLRASISHNVTTTPTGVTVTVGSPLEYAAYQERGTGIYGPHGTPIVPVTAKVLKFRGGGKNVAKGKRPWVFAASVAGSKPTWFLTRALESIIGTTNVRRHPQ